MKTNRKIRDIFIVCCFFAALLLLTDQTESRRRIACVGDSITQGVEVAAGQSYPSYLQKLLGEKYDVHNYGRQGRALLSSSRWPYQKEDVYRRSREDAADVYLIMLGSNDIWEETWDPQQFEEELVQFVRSYQEVQTEPCVYLIKPPEYFPAETDVQGQQKKLRMQELYRRIELAAGTSECGLIDLYSYTKEHPEWFADEVHPNGWEIENCRIYLSMYL